MTNKSPASRNIRLISWFNLFDGFRFYNPILLIYFAQVTGSYASASIITGASILSSAFFEVPTGVISDRIGRRFTILNGAILSMLAVFLYAVGESFNILLIGAIIEGIALSFYSGNNTAFIYENIDSENKKSELHNYLSKVYSKYHYAAAVAAVIGGFLAADYLSLAIWFSLIPLTVCVALALLMTEPKVHSKKSGNTYDHLGEAIREFRKNPRLRRLTIAGIIEHGVGHSLFGLSLVFINGIWSVWALGIWRMMASIFAALGFSASGKINTKFGTEKTVVFSGLWGRATTVLALAKPMVVSPIFLALSSLSFGPGQVAANTLEQHEFTDHQRATMGSLSSLVGSIFFGLVMILLGFMVDKIGVVNTMLIGQIPLLGATYLYATLKKKPKTTQ